MVFKSLENLSTAAIRRELASRDSKVRTLHKQRDRILAKIAAIDAKIVECGGEVAPTSRGTTRKRPVNSGTLVEALHARLTASKSPMGVSELADAVQKDGYKTNSKTFRTIVNQALIKHTKRFKKLGRGQYVAKGKAAVPGKKRAKKSDRKVRVKADFVDAVVLGEVGK